MTRHHISLNDTIPREITKNKISYTSSSRLVVPGLCDFSNSVCLALGIISTMGEVSSMSVYCVSSLMNFACWSLRSAFCVG
jgi:hypothetical protein